MLHAYHFNASTDDFIGNQSIGRYVFLPGSDGRAQELAEHFSDLTVKSHARGHHLYLGTLTHHDHKIDVAAISSGMGCPSMEIILHELFQLGAKRFLRIGTAGSLQPHLVKCGDFINVLASVRDEDTTSHYAPKEVPAIASPEFNSAILTSASQWNLQDRLHSGIVHCKSSFYAREFGKGPMALDNNQYIDQLSQYGTLASEMETAALFIQSQLYHHQARLQGQKVLAGALLAIVSSADQQFSAQDELARTTQQLIKLALSTMTTLAYAEIAKASYHSPAMVI